MTNNKTDMNKNRHSLLTMERWSNTSSSRWILLARLAFVLFIILLTYAHTIQISYAKENDSVNLYLDIGFDSNLIFNKYDVSIELDGERLDTVEYGSYYTKLCEVKPGKHIIRVYKDDDSDVMGEKNIQVEEDTTFQCHLNTKRKEIELEETKTIKGIAGHSIEMPDCEGFHLVDALEVLKQKGFVNCRYEGNTEEKIKEKTWAVDVQNVKAGEGIDKNDEIVLTCIPAEEYIKKTFPGLTYSEAIEKAKAIGYKSVQKVDARQKADEPVKLKDAEITDEAKEYWTVKTAEDKYADDATLVLNFVYNVPMPDLSKVGLEKADSRLKTIQQGHFNYDFVGYKTGDSITHDNYKKYYIIEQSLESGTAINYQTTITFKCKKTKAAKEAEKKAAAAAKAEAERKAQEERESKLNMDVWYTNSGDCYHIESCWHLRSKNGPITQREAIARGMEPCGDCIKAWILP